MARLSSTLELESLHKRQKGRVAKTSSNIAQYPLNNGEGKTSKNLCRQTDRVGHTQILVERPKPLESEPEKG